MLNFINQKMIFRAYFKQATPGPNLLVKNNKNKSCKKKFDFIEFGM